MWGAGFDSGVVFVLTVVTFADKIKQLLLWKHRHFFYFTLVDTPGQIILPGEEVHAHGKSEQPSDMGQLGIEGGEDEGLYNHEIEFVSVQEHATSKRQRTQKADSLRPKKILHQKENQKKGAERKTKKGHRQLAKARENTHDKRFEMIEPEFIDV